MRLWILLASVLGASGVGLGAYQAHGLASLLEKQELDEAAKTKRLQNCEVAVRYQMMHALAFLGLAALGMRMSSRLLSVTAWLWLVGVICFSGMLYAYAFAGFMIGPVVPLGGLAMICGWITLAVASLNVQVDHVTDNRNPGSSGSD